MSVRKNTRLRLVTAPSEELVQKALDRLRTMDLANFADHVETARTVWRKFPELVEAPVFPEQLRAAYVEERGEEPSDDCGLGGEEALEPGYRDSILPNAIEVALGWMHRNREENSDAKFLRRLGIAVDGPERAG